MHARHALWIVTLFASTLLVVGCTKKEPEADTKKAKDDTCPQVYDVKENPDGLKCTCKKDLVKGKIWGDGTYMTGSATCAAAAHIGAIKKGKGGKITIKNSPGCSSYKGGKKNGITSEFWSGNDSSFYFDGFGDGSCP